MPRTEFDAFKEGVEKELKALSTFRDTQQGMAKQSDLNKSSIVGYVGLSIGILSLIWGIAREIISR